MTISLSEVTRAEHADIGEIPATSGSPAVPAPRVAALGTAGIITSFPIRPVTPPDALAGRAGLAGRVAGPDVIAGPAGRVGLAGRVAPTDVIAGPHAAGRSAGHRSQRSRRRR